MAKKLFNIIEETNLPNYTNCRLLMEASRYNFLYTVTDENKQAVKLCFYELESHLEQELVQELQEIIREDEVLKESYKEIRLLYNFPESQLVPDSYFKVSINGAFSELINGDLNKGIRLSEKIKGYGLHNVFTVPASLYQLFREHYKENKHCHYYSWWLQCLQTQLLSLQETLQVIFYPGFILVAAVKNQQLHLVQQFTYQTAEDVVYYLLNISFILQFSPQIISLRLLGMIDVSSRLFNELQKYFGNISMEQPAELPSSLNFTEYPPHFFSPILKLAACVS
jgi:hypothetical protein